MGVHTRASNAHSNVSSRNASHSVDENSLASAAAGAASRPARLKSTALSNKAPNAGGAANIKAENAPRSALSSVSLSNTNAQKPGTTTAAASKALTGPKATSSSTTSTNASTQKMAAVASRKARVPLSAVDNGSRPQIYRDPAPRPARPRRAAAAAAEGAIHAALAGKPTRHQPVKILRSASASNVPPPTKHTLKASAATANNSDGVAAACTQAAAKPMPLAGRKRRANSAEPVPTRAVRPKLASGTSDVAQSATAHHIPASQAAATTAVPAFTFAGSAGSEETFSMSSSAGSRADSQATVVESDHQQQKQPPALAHRKIAKPSRAFSSLHSTAEPSPFDIDVSLKAEPACDWDDIDADDADDPLMVAEYIGDIIGYLRKLEQKTMPDVAYMAKQVELSWEMRRVLVNWLVQIHYQLRMLPETLFLAVNLVDRFLSKRQVSVSKLQLVGLSGLLVACKYEEMTTPHIQDFAYLAGNCYSVEEIMNAEVFMLRVLDFDMSYPSPLTFLRRVSKAEQYNMQTRTVAKYLMEICLVDHRLMPFSSSAIAAAGICLARRMLKAGPWDGNLRHYSGYTEEELQPCMRLVLDHLLRTQDDEFLFKKYQHRRYLKASLFCREWVSRHRHELVPVSPPIGDFAASGGAL